MKQLMSHPIYERISLSIFWILLILTPACTAQIKSGSPAPLFVSAQNASFNIGKRPLDIVLSDLNKDGKLDIVTCNEGDSVTVFFGNRAGGFTAAPGGPIRVAAHLIALGDVNNDGAVDLTATHHDRAGVEVLLGMGDGKFGPAANSPFSAHQRSKAHNHGLALNDINSDGNLDITTSNQEDNSLSVLLGNGRGGFSPAAGSPFAVGQAPYPHAVGDVNRDGKADIVTPNVRSNNVTVLLGDGRGGFSPTPKSPFGVASRPYYVAVADVNADGKADLVATHDDIGLITTLLGDGKGDFTQAPTSPFDLGRQAYKLVAADVNGDDRVDLVIGTDAGVAVLLTNADGSYVLAPGSPFGSSVYAKFAVGDVNGDGRPELITATEAGDITVLLPSRPAAKK